MARRPRIHVPGGLYHVIARGNRREVIFKGPADYGDYLRRLEEGLRRTGVRCLAYMLMPNHVHLLLEPGQVPLARLMQGLQQGYTQAFNRRHRAVGHVFQGRYTAILCDRDAYLLELVRYLHLNPVRANLTSNPAAYRWSSHRAYLGRESRTWISVEPILGMFGGNLRGARRAYAGFIADGMAQGHRGDLYEVWEQRYLGDEGFVAGMERQARDVTATARLISLEDILNVVAQEFGCSPQEMMAPGQQHVAAQARRWVALLACDVAGEQVKTVSKFLERSPGSLSVGLTRLRRSLLEKRDEGERRNRLVNALKQRGRPRYSKGKVCS